MADTKISGLPASTTPLAGTEVLPIVQSSNTVQVSVANLTAGRAVSALSLTSTNGATIQGLTVGRGAGAVASNTAVGASALVANTAGANNTALGASSLNATITAGNSTAVGFEAGKLSTGIGNQFFGYSSGSAVTSGAKNVIFGSYTGSAAPISATGSNFVVLSDGDGNIVASTKTANTFALPGGTLSSGTGIAFPATQSASTNANTLDDYEEGTWTPIPSTAAGGTITSYVSAGRYTKIGRQVLLELRINITNVGTAIGTLDFSGIPFTPSSAVGDYNYGFGVNRGVSTSVVIPFQIFNPGPNITTSITIATGLDYFASITYTV